MGKLGESGSAPLKLPLYIYCLKTENWCEIYSFSMCYWCSSVTSDEDHERVTCACVWIIVRSNCTNSSASLLPDSIIFQRQEESRWLETMSAAVISQDKSGLFLDSQLRLKMLFICFQEDQQDVLLHWIGLLLYVFTPQTLYHKIYLSCRAKNFTGKNFTTQRIFT